MMAEFNSSSINDLECPVFTDDSEDLVQSVTFWIEGIVCCCIALPGFLGNIGSSYVLSTKDMRNSFNLLLIALACFDNVYLFGGILESLRKDFGLQTRVHVVLFPYLLYPLHTIAMTGSIFLTVAIALERYIAVHHPLNYSQTSNDGGALKRRMLKYLLPVSLLSLLFNVTKFFEATYEYGEDDEMPVLKATELRTDPIYSIYFNWFRFVSVGVVPFGLLVLFNARIYYALRQRKKRAGFRRAGANATASAAPAPSMAGLHSQVASPENKRCNSSTRCQKKAKKSYTGSIFKKKKERSVKEDSNEENQPDMEAEEIFRENLAVELRQHHPCNNVSEFDITDSVAQSAAAYRLSLCQQQGDMNSSNNSNNSNNSNSNPRVSSTLLQQQEDDNNKLLSSSGNLLHSSSSFRQKGLAAKVKFEVRISSGSEEDIVKEEKEEERTGGVTLLVVGKESKLRGFYNSSIRKYRDRENTSFVEEGAKTGSGTQLNAMGSIRKDVAKANARRRSMEDHMATIFMGYILVFLICHSPRLVLNIYELVTIRHAVLCQSAGFKPFPLWSHILTNLSHLMLTVNSSINILIYCCLSSRFRQEVTNVGRRLLERLRKSDNDMD